MSGLVTALGRRFRATAAFVPRRPATSTGTSPAVRTPSGGCRRSGRPVASRGGKPLGAAGALFALAGLLAVPEEAFAQQQHQGFCARVRIQIQQELTLERIGFEATLEVTNNDPEESITDFFAELTFTHPETQEDVADLFFVRAPETENIQDVEGGGVIGPLRTAVIRWFIIPKIDAGGTSPNGIHYMVGANLGGRLGGIPIPEEMLLVIPDDIHVMPEPQLDITYFQPRHVQANNPFTDRVEAPIPFTLGVLVRNVGHGWARHLEIASEQPRIVENETGLLLVAQLLGARVNDSPLDRTSLTVDLGDIAPGEATKGSWDMITSLSGEFVAFNASYTHASELGGEETSLIVSLEAHFMAQEVMSDLPGRDDVSDFLAIVNENDDLIPDTLYETDGIVSPVHHLINVSLSGSAGPGQTVLIEASADTAGWNYMRLDDPGQHRLAIERVVRNDGKVLHRRNAWTSLRYEVETNRELTFLHVFDHVDTGDYTYAVTYAETEVDTEPPVTSIEFVGDSTQVDGTWYITPDTQIFFLAEDESPVSMFYRIDDGDRVPAHPFHLGDPGSYTIGYFSEDVHGNVEEEQFAEIIVVSGDDELLIAFDLERDRIFNPGEAISVRPDRSGFNLTLGDVPFALQGNVDIFREVRGWVQVGGVPSSPSPDDFATLAVTGDHVDFYRYRHNGGAWSDARPVDDPIVLSGLATGEHTVSVVGRSAHGEWADEEDAVTVQWTVNPGGPPTRVTAPFATPRRTRTAQLHVGGDGVTHYRWRLDDGHFQAERPVDEPIQLSELSSGVRTVSVIARVDGQWQAESEATVFTWTVDPLYGSDFTPETRVRNFPIAAGGQIFWDGLDDAGEAVAPGWYTVRVLLEDGLGRSVYSTDLVRVEDLGGPPEVVADAARGPSRPHARGKRVVWQDQVTGSRNIFARRLSGGTGDPVQVTDAVRSQERPRTDGRYVVWQARRSDGAWDIWMRDLDAGGDSQPVVESSETDDTRPAVDWPWVVWQARPIGVSGAPWQVRARNLITGETFTVDPAAGNQNDPVVESGRVVWWDERHPSPGEIYFADLETGERRRITNDPFAQTFPVIDGPWIVWQDNRDQNLQIYGYDLLADREMRLSQTASNLEHPRLDGPWVVCLDDGAVTGGTNLRLIHIPTRATAPLTRTPTDKSDPGIGDGRAVWLEEGSGGSRVVRSVVPSLQPVFQNRNMVVVTDAMVEFLQDAFSLLTHWQEAAGVQEISRITAFDPAPQTETVAWGAGVPEGDNFNLAPGDVLWIGFGEGRVLDLGVNGEAPVELDPGINVLAYPHFPSGFRAYDVVDALGMGNVRAIRMLDAESGRWQTVEIRGGRRVGHNFDVPNVAVLLIEMENGVTEWQP